MKPNGKPFAAAIVTLVAAGISIAAEAGNGTPLRTVEIRKYLVGKQIKYNPPGWADTAMVEDFHPDGRWDGVLYGIGPQGFSGRWSVTDNQICVAADSGYFARWHPGRYCRKVWRDQKTGNLQTLYLGDEPGPSNKFGLQSLTVSDLAKKM